MERPAVAVTGRVARRLAFATADLAEAESMVADVAQRLGDATGPIGRGRAVPAAVLIDPALPDPAATHATVVSADGYRASIPLDTLRTGGWLAFGLGDEPLPHRDGGPFRLVVADGATLCWNVKRVAELRVTVGPEPDDVPARPTH